MKLPWIALFLLASSIHWRFEHDWRFDLDGKTLYLSRRLELTTIEEDHCSIYRYTPTSTRWSEIPEFGSFGSIRLRVPDHSHGSGILTCRETIANLYTMGALVLNPVLAI